MANNASKSLGESGAYWAERMRVYEQACSQKNAKILAQIEAALSKANSSVKKDLEYWYNRLDKNGGISLASARRLLTAEELAEFKWNVNEYMKKASEIGNSKWLKELESASARSHISRLDAMKLSVRNTLESVFRAENSAVTKIAVDSYSGAVRHTAAEAKKFFGVDFDIGDNGNEKIQKLIRKPWTSDKRTFSDRIWAKKEQMIGELQEELTRSCIYGKSLDETIERVERLVDSKFKNAKYAARRLVVTENAYFRTLGTCDELAELGVEKFQVDLPINSHSCEVCRAMNGRIFPISEFMVGLNAPPFHPNCENGGIIPVLDDDLMTPIAYGAPPDLQNTLGERKSVNDDLTNAENSGIIKSIGDLKVNSQPHDIASDLRDTNPNFSNGIGYDKNCGNCVIVYELRRRGYDVEARPSKLLNADAILGMFNGFIPLGYAGEKYKSFSKADIISDIIQEAKKWGDGARGIVKVQWPGSKYGHFFSIEVEKGEVLFLNPQDGGSAMRFFDSADFLKTVFGRTDKLEFTENVITACKNKER